MTLAVHDALEVEYDNRAHVPEHPQILDRWLQEAAEFRQERLDLNLAVLDISYGSHERHTYDLFKAMPDTFPAPRTALFVHGGYWRSLDKSYFSQVARSLTARGYDVAATNYRLCPEVTISEILEDVRRVAIHLYEAFGRKLLPYGHSAGGHLVSSLLATKWQDLGLPEDLASSGMVVSGVYDLNPVLQISVNKDVRLTEKEAQDVSTRFWPDVSVRDLAVVVGGSETTAFVNQSKDFYEDWKPFCDNSTLDVLEGANHFTVVDPLSDPNSDIANRLAALGAKP